MTTLAFDSLKYARRLRDAGVPEPQADVQAELMAEAFGFYAENILTRDHFTEVLNARFGEFGAQMDARFTEQGAKFDKRFSEQDAKFDKRFAEQDVKFDKRFSEQDAKFDKRFAEQDANFFECFADQNARFEARFGKLEKSLFLHTWMLGFLVVAIGVPQVQAWLG